MFNFLILFPVNKFILFFFRRFVDIFFTMTGWRFSASQQLLIIFGLFLASQNFVKQNSAEAKALKFCPPGGPKFLFAWSLACEMRKKRSVEDDLKGITNFFLSFGGKISLEKIRGKNLVSIIFCDVFGHLGSVRIPRSRVKENCSNN